MMQAKPETRREIEHEHHLRRDIKRATHAGEQLVQHVLAELR